MKKTTLSRIIAISLLASMGFATACGDSGASGSDTTAASGDITTDNAVTTSNLYNDLPTGDFGGEEFNIMNNSFDYAEYRIAVDEQNGDTFNDAVFERTSKVEELLNVDIVVNDMDFWGTNAASELTKLVLAGDDTYDIGFIGLYSRTANLAQGAFTDLRQIKEFDFDKPWWDKNSIDVYDLGGTLYAMHNELSANIHDQIWACFFNKDIAEDNKVGDLYQIVRDGDWTLDKMLTLIESTKRDIDGDGKLGADDQFGLMTHFGAAFTFLHGSGIRGIDIKDGQPFVREVDDYMFDVITKTQKIMANEGTFQNNVQGGSFGYNCVPGFAEGKGLFLIEVLGNAASLRDMDTDFGIIPFPKYDEKQEEYISYFSPASNALVVPKTTQDLSRVGVVVENLCAYGHQMIRPAYYEVVLTGKTVRDNESSEMLDIMFANLETDLGYLYGWGNYGTILRDACATQTDDVMSKLASAKTPTEEAIKQYVESLK